MVDNEEGVAVVKMGDDKHLVEHLHSLPGEEGVNPPAVVKEKSSEATASIFIIQGHSQVPSCLSWLSCCCHGNVNVVEMNRSW